MYGAARQAAFKSVSNPRFQFRLEIPDAWRAHARSGNGDGFFLDTGEEDVDARVYGSYFDDVDKRVQRRRFTFADGRMGWQEAAPGQIRFVRKAGSRYLSFYLKAPPSWLAQHAREVGRVARSLRPVDSPTASRPEGRVTPAPPPPPGSAASRPS